MFHTKLAVCTWRACPVGVVHSNEPARHAFLDSSHHCGCHVKLRYTLSEDNTWNDSNASCKKKVKKHNPFVRRLPWLFPPLRRRQKAYQVHFLQENTWNDSNASRKNNTLHNFLVHRLAPGPTQAKTLMIKSFADIVVERFVDKSLRERITPKLLAAAPREERAVKGQFRSI